MQEEHRAKKNSELKIEEWTLRHAQNIPRQNNSSDCGMFVIKYCQYFSESHKMDFNPKDMNYYRQRLIYEIKTCDLQFP